MDVPGKDRSREIRLSEAFHKGALRRAKELGFGKGGAANLSAYIRFLVAKDSIAQSRGMLDMSPEEARDLWNVIDELTFYHMFRSRQYPHGTKQMLAQTGLNIFLIDQALQRARSKNPKGAGSLLRNSLLRQRSQESPHL